MEYNIFETKGEDFRHLAFIPVSFQRPIHSDLTQLSGELPATDADAQGVGAKLVLLSHVQPNC